MKMLYFIKVQKLPFSIAQLHSNDVSGEQTNESHPIFI